MVGMRTDDLVISSIYAHFAGPSRMLIQVTEDEALLSVNIRLAEKLGVITGCSGKALLVLGRVFQRMYASEIGLSGYWKYRFVLQNLCKKPCAELAERRSSNWFNQPGRLS